MDAAIAMFFGTFMWFVICTKNPDDRIQARCVQSMLEAVRHIIVHLRQPLCRPGPSHKSGFHLRGHGRQCKPM